MAENMEPGHHFPDDEWQGAISDHLARARAAEGSGDFLLSMYLYLAAFEESTLQGALPSEDALYGLKQAWHLAYSHKERSMAEYIFERLEPYLTNEEMALCSDQLQSLALDRLEEFGLSRDELENVAQMISEDILGLDDAPIKIESFVTHSRSRGKESEGLASGEESVLADAIPVDAADSSESARDGASEGEESPTEYLEHAAQELAATMPVPEEKLDYSTIAGYDSVIDIMRQYGIGMGQDEDFKKLVDLLNARHGLSQMPALDTLMFRSPAREDANRFMMATLGELNMPTIHMCMEESIQGMPILCVSAQAIDIPKSNSLKDVFTSGGVLVLQDLDLWTSPVSEMGDDPSALFMMQLTRGAREAVNLIRTAVENPEVYVIATASSKGAVDGFFLDALEPLSIIDIENPTPEERVGIWMDIAHEHPSIRSINKTDLVRLSANMPRYDIYMAAREAVEEAYKAGLVARKYQAVSRDNLFDKLAAYQPLESEEYTELEDAVVTDFRRDLDSIDDILRGE